MFLLMDLQTGIRKKEKKKKRGHIRTLGHEFTLWDTPSNELKDLTFSLSDRNLSNFF